MSKLIGGYQPPNVIALDAKIKELEERNRGLVEAMKFYANPQNYINLVSFIQSQRLISGAREALKKWGGE